MVILKVEFLQGGLNIGKSSVLDEPVPGGYHKGSETMKRDQNVRGNVSADGLVAHYP